MDSDEYIEDYYCGSTNELDKTQARHYICTNLSVARGSNVVNKMCTDVILVDPTTLAIHFPDMLDSEGNKIFASLQEDGKGGDITLSKDNLGNIRKGIFIWHKYAMCIDIKNIEIIVDKYNFKGIPPSQYKNFTEIIGIQQ